MDERQKFIDVCIAMEELLKEEERLHKAAIVIQSAWRGHVVRQQLEKYKNDVQKQDGRRKRKKLDRKKRKR